MLWPTQALPLTVGCGLTQSEERIELFDGSENRGQLNRVNKNVMAEIAGVDKNGARRRGGHWQSK